jgi:P-type Cu+ transporter
MLAYVKRGLKGETMHTDPVCGMEVTPETAVGAWEHDGTTYYFCSAGCLERFREDPERFLHLTPNERGMS